MLDDIDKHLADIESVSEEIREKAILALAATNDVQAIFALKKAAKQDDSLRLRNLARKCLIDLKKEITAVGPDLFDDDDDRHVNLKKLKTNLTAADPKIRLNAVRSTVSFKDKKAIPILSAQVAGELDPVVKGSMLIAIGILGRSEEIPFLSGVLKKDTDPLVRKAAIEGLSYAKDVGAYAMILRAFVSDRDKLVERACMKALNKLGKANLMKLLDRMSGSSQTWKRQVAVRAMGRFNSETVVPSLERACTDKDESVSALAQRSLFRLAKHGNPSAKEAIDRLRLAEGAAPPADQEGSVILETSTTVGIDDPDPNVRLQIIQAMANGGDMLKFPVLRERLKAEPHDYVKAAVVTALYRLGGRAAIPILKECFKDKENARVRANAVECLSKVGDESNSPLFIQMLKDPDGRTRANAIVALKKCTYIDPVRYIHEMIESRDDLLVRSAMYAIIEIGSDKAVALLADLAQSDAAPIREKAMEHLEILKERNNSAAKKLLVRIKGEQKGQERRQQRAETGTRKTNLEEEKVAAKAAAMRAAEERAVAAELEEDEEEEPPPPPKKKAKAPKPVIVQEDVADEAPVLAKEVKKGTPGAVPVRVVEVEEEEAPPAKPPPTRPPPEPPSRPAPPEKPNVEIPGLQAKAKPAPKPDGKGGFRLPFDTSHGFSFATIESIKAWLDRLPAAWRIALVALCMVWGMVLLMLVIQFFRTDELA